mgnify:CR=1 FL=1
MVRKADGWRNDLNKKADKIKDEIKQIYKDFDSELDIKVTAKVLAYYVNSVPRQYVGGNYYADAAENEKTFSLWAKKSIITNAHIWSIATIRTL